MKLTRGRTLKVNLGNYEGDELMAVVSIEDTDLFDEDELADMTPDEVMAALKEHCEKYLADTLEQPLRTAAEVSQAKDTILHDLKPAPARRERTTRRSTR